MLARYCSDFVVFRECIQNADDASATTCTINFQTKGKHIQEISVTNDGRVFQEKDWTRLTRIAEGNPDESTVVLFFLLVASPRNFVSGWHVRGWILQVCTRFKQCS